MDRAKGSALEWALALLRAPGERYALRQKPLPVGVDRLLNIAAGISHTTLAEAALSFGEDEARIREAARFYAREVLFFPQADAYRVLGVSADASAEKIKNHHRLLQHWLHPDRVQSEDDVVFAARVNGAWNHLRSAERRYAYDATLRERASPAVFPGSDGVNGMPVWIAEEGAKSERWRHRLPMLVLTAACLLLILLVLRDRERRPEAWDLPQRDTPTIGADESIAISVPHHEEVEGPTRESRKSDSSDAVRQVPSIAGLIASSHVNRAKKVASPVLAVKATVALPSSMTAVSEATTSAIERPHIQSEPPPMVVAVEPVPRNASAQSAAKALAPNFARIQSARQAGDQFLRYMGGVHRAAPPIWNSPAIQSSADRMRHALHDNGRIRLLEAQWRIGSEAAVLASGYELQGNQAGVLTADLIWREGRWLVTGVSMEQAR